MPWYSKEQPTPFDSTPIEGLYFLHGDVMARRYSQEWVKGQKYPLIIYPSGIEREVLMPQAGNMPVIHLFGTVDLPYSNDRDDAVEAILPIAEEYGYQISRRGERELTVFNPDAGRGYRVSYDNQSRRIADIVHFPEYAMELLDGKSRAVLPKLYSMEKLGLEAVAPVKFFTPDANYTWYPTEYDGRDLMFGLVAGHELEFGYFSAEELESVRGGLGLPVERDLYYQPKTLRELKDWHEQQR